jgi:hypothetical protein
VSTVSMSTRRCRTADENSHEPNRAHFEKPFLHNDTHHTSSETVGELSDEESPKADNHPVFIQSRTGTAGGSNPTPGATG